MKLNTIKNLLRNRMLNTLSYRTGGILSGILAQIVLVNGCIHVKQDPLHTLISLIYGFCVLLPLSHYQMQMAENMNE